MILTQVHTTYIHENTNVPTVLDVLASSGTESELLYDRGLVLGTGTRTQDQWILYVLCHTVQ